MRLFILMTTMLLSAHVASAGYIVTQDVSGTPSWGDVNDEDNIELDFNLAGSLGFSPGTPMLVVGIGYDVTISTIGASWLTEAVCCVGAAGSASVCLKPGEGMLSGTETFHSDIQSITDTGGIFLPDGFVSLYFYEETDDYPDNVDAWWTSGEFVFDVVPGVHLSQPTITDTTAEFLASNITPRVTNHLYGTFDPGSTNDWVYIRSFTCDCSRIYLAFPYSNGWATAFYKIVAEVD